MELYSHASGGHIKAKAYSDAKNEKPKVENPFLCDLLIMTPNSVYGAIQDDELLTKGFVNRRVFVDASSTAVERPVGYVFPDDSSPEARRVLAVLNDRLSVPHRKNAFKNLTDTVGGFPRIVVPLDRQLKDRIDAAMRTARDRHEPDAVERHLYNRVVENAKRIAAIGVLVDWAAYEGPLRISPAMIEWAYRFVMDGVEAFIRGRAANAAEGSLEMRVYREARKLLANPDNSRVQRDPLWGKCLRNGYIPKSALIEATRFGIDGRFVTGRERNEAIGSLIESGRFEVLFKGSLPTDLVPDRGPKSAEYYRVS